MVGTVEVEMCTALLEVQRLDTVLDELATQGAAFPHKAKVAKIAQKAAEGTALITKLEEGIVKIESQIEASAEVVEQQKAKIAKDQHDIDAGAVDYRQIEALTADLAAHNAHIDAEEAKQMQLLETKYSARARIEEYRTKIAELESAKDRTLVAYRQELGALATKTKQITAERDEARAKVSAELLEQYDTLRAQRGGTVVARYDGKRCKACSLALPTAVADQFAQPGDTGTCSECRRILIYLGDSNESEHV